jgi:hypothetical protein
MKLPAKLALASLAALALAVPASAQNATTDPVGFVTNTVRASSNGIAYSATPISPVLLAASSVNGTITGAITSIGNTTITIASAGWTNDQLPASDVNVLFKTGNLTGLILPVTANTADTLTVSTEGLNLSSIGGSVGDSIQLVQGDTLASMFGDVTNGVFGGNATQFSASQTDKVTTTDSSGTVRVYYYNTQFNQWRRSGSSTDQSFVRISPTAGALYSRISTSNMTITTTGNVPVAQVKYIVPTSGSRYFARYFPTDGNINDFGFQNLPGWRSTNQSGVTTATADKIVTTDSGGTVRTYYYDGTAWKRSGSSSSQNTVTVPVGGSVQTTRFGSGNAEVATVSLPYSL